MIKLKTWWDRQSRLEQLGWGFVAIWIVILLALSVESRLNGETSRPVSVVAAPAVVAPSTTLGIGGECAGTLRVPPSPPPPAVVAPSTPGLRCVNGLWVGYAEPGSLCLGPPVGASLAGPEGEPMECSQGGGGGRVWFLLGQTLSSFFNGSFVVGTSTGNVEPGTYRAPGVEDCYWERVGPNGIIIDNNFVTAGPQTFTVYAGETLSVRGGCGQFIKD